MAEEANQPPVLLWREIKTGWGATLLTLFTGHPAGADERGYAVEVSENGVMVRQPGMARFTAWSEVEELRGDLPGCFARINVRFDETIVLDSRHGGRNPEDRFARLRQAAIAHGVLVTDRTTRGEGPTG